MIYIENLTKIYSSKKGKCCALDNISLTLPNSGMIFVVGESGSGKSTLLNLLGGVDDITSGEITVDGIKFSQIKGDGFDSFRNSYMGFIFQDYYLIENLTVFENVRLALDLKGEEDDKKVSEILDKLLLGDLSKRLPKELSGGQQQRVAIARAIVKHPKLILADEPTGNLDENTTTQILDILKELSKTSLVLIVSHNLENAYRYGDRIIRLSHGKIKSDVSRSKTTKNQLTIKKNEIILPNGAALSEKDIEKINKKVKKGDVKISQKQATFIGTKKVRKTSYQKPKLTPSKLPFNSTLSLAGKFTRSGVFNFIVSTLIVSFLVVLFGLCQMLFTYNGNSLLNHVLDSNESTYILQKAYEMGEVFKSTKTDKLNQVTQSDLQSFIDNGYSGNMYLIYNDALIFDNKNYYLECARPINQNVEFREFYAEQAFGTLKCDEEYLRKTFPEMEELNYEELAPYGLIFTDYMADCILLRNPIYQRGSTEESYECLLSTNAILGRYKINAIINTGYKEKYSQLIQKIFNLKTTNDQAAAKQVYSSKEFLDFVNDARLRLNLAYTTSDDYLTSSIQNPTITRHFTRLLNVEIYDQNGNKKHTSERGKDFAYVDRSLEDDEVVLKTNLFEEIFSEPFDANKTYEMTIKLYDVASNRDDEPLINKTYKVKRVEEDINCSIQFNENNFTLFRQYDTFPYAVLFDNKDDIGLVHSVGQDNLLYSNAPQISPLLTILNAISLYKNLFLIIAAVLFFAGFLILVNFGRKNVRSKAYEIGLIRALGGRKSEIIKIFVLQMLLAGLIIAIISTGGMFLMVHLVNMLLSTSVIKISKNPFLEGLRLFALNPLDLVINIIAVIVISALAFTIPLILLNRIKPINIIKNRD